MISEPVLTQAIVEQKQNLEANLNVGGESFTLMTAGIHTTIRDSSLYRVIEDLISENLASVKTKQNAEPVALLNAYRVEPHTDIKGCKAWLIHFETKPEYPLFSKEGFEFQGSHIRIDARFANDNTLKAKQGLSVCHYTAQYAHPVTQESVAVHGYIGKNGIISYQIKKYKLGRDGGENLAVTPLLKEIIQKNAELPLVLVGKLLKEKHERYMKAEKKSYEIETELNAIVQKILINSTQSSHRLALKADYGVLVNCFLAEIKIINRYNDQEIDQRGVLLMQFYARMNRPESVLEATESQEVSESQVELADPLGSTQKTVSHKRLSNKAKNKIDAQAKKDTDLAVFLIAEIKALMEKLKRLAETKEFLETDELIVRQTLKQAVHEKLIEMAFVPGITQADNAYLEEAAEALNNIPALFESFKHAIELGDIDRVAAFYPHVQHENLTSIFYNLIVKRLALSKGEALEKIIAVLKFFYENSNRYHMFIRRAEDIYIDLHSYQSSVLFDAFTQNNYSAFKLMLEHGFNPNGVGIICEEVVASILNGIACLMRSSTLGYTDTRYIKTLLDFGALVDRKIRTDSYRIAERCGQIIKKEQTKSLEGAEDLPDPSALKTILRLNSTLEILCGSDNVSNELLALFLPVSSLSSLIASLVSMINSKSIKTRFVVGTSDPNFIICENQVAADKMASILNANSACQKYVSHITYHTNPQEAKHWVENTQTLKEAVMKKSREILEQYPQCMTILYEALLKKAKTSKELTDKVDFHTCVLYLQLLNADVSFQSTQKIVQSLCHLGQAYFNHRLIDPIVSIRTTNAFSYALLCCINLECGEALRATPLFDFAKRKLVELGVDLRPFNLPPQTMALSALTEPVIGRRIIPAAVIHARETPSLTMLANANAEIPSQPPVTSTQENVKEKKKKKNGVKSRLRTD